MHQEKKAESAERARLRETAPELVSSHQCAGRRRIRYYHLSGDAGRPRGDHSDGADVAGRTVADQDRAGLDQHGATSAAVVEALPQSRPRGRPRHRKLCRQLAGHDRWYRRAVAPA